LRPLPESRGILSGQKFVAPVQVDPLEHTFPAEGDQLKGLRASRRPGFQRFAARICEESTEALSLLASSGPKAFAQSIIK
jgi:hypothetical protein